MANAEKWLVFVVRLNAVMMMFAVLAVIMPFAWMAEIHAALGLGQLPDAPIVSYLARSVSAFYAINGVFLLVVSFDVRRYGPLITVMAVCFVASGLMFLVVDSLVRMPLFWILTEGPYVTATGCLILWLQRISRPYDR